MAYFLFKTLLTAFIVAAIAGLSKQFSTFAALLASLPLVSILAFIWIYVDTRDSQKIISMSYDVFWLVLPSLGFFLILPTLLKQGMAFGWALAIASIGMALLYAATMALLKGWLR